MTDYEICEVAYRCVKCNEVRVAGNKMAWVKEYIKHSHICGRCSTAQELEFQTLLTREAFHSKYPEASAIETEKVIWCSSYLDIDEERLTSKQGEMQMQSYDISLMKRPTPLEERDMGKKPEVIVPWQQIVATDSHSATVLFGAKNAKTVLDNQEACLEIMIRPFRGGRVE